MTALNAWEVTPSLLNTLVIQCYLLTSILATVVTVKMQINFSVSESHLTCKWTSHTWHVTCLECCWECRRMLVRDEQTAPAHSSSCAAPSSTADPCELHTSTQSNERSHQYLPTYNHGCCTPGLSPSSRTKRIGHSFKILQS